MLTTIPSLGLSFLCLWIVLTYLYHFIDFCSSFTCSIVYPFFWKLENLVTLICWWSSVLFFLSFQVFVHEYSCASGGWCTGTGWQWWFLNTQQWRNSWAKVFNTSCTARGYNFSCMCFLTLNSSFSPDHQFHDTFVCKCLMFKLGMQYLGAC